MADFVLGLPSICYYNPAPYTTFRVRVTDMDWIEVLEWINTGNYLFCYDDADHGANRLQLASKPTVNLDEGYIEFITTTAPAGSLTPDWVGARVAPILGSDDPTVSSDLSTIIGLVDKYNVDDDIIWMYEGQVQPSIYNDHVVDPCRIVGMVPSCGGGCLWLAMASENFVGTATFRNIHFIPDSNWIAAIINNIAGNTGSYNIQRCTFDGNRYGVAIKTGQDDAHDGTITFINNLVYGGNYTALWIDSSLSTSFETIEMHHNIFYYTSLTFGSSAWRIKSYLNPTRIHMHNNLVIGTIFPEAGWFDMDGNASYNAPGGAVNHINLSAYTNKQIGLDLNLRLTNKIYEDSVLAGAGQAEALVGIDINGRTRDASTPTIGPWEAQPLLARNKGARYV